MGYATISEISRRWQVDPATARAALQRAHITPCELFVSPRYSWDDVLRKIEGWDEAAIENADFGTCLEKADDLAVRLGVTTQTIRNYGQRGTLQRVNISPRAIRYSLNRCVKMESEEKSGELGKK